MNKTNKIIIALVVLVLAIPVIAIGGFGLRCKSQQMQVRSKNSQVIEDFNKVTIDTSNPELEANVYLGGDCVDSQPFVQVTKTYSINSKGNVLLADVKSNLAKQQFVISDEKYLSNNCGTYYTAKASRSGLIFSLKLSEHSGDEAACYASSPIDEATFGLSNLRQIYARLQT